MSPITHFTHVDPVRTAIVLGEQKISFSRFANDIDEMSLWLSRQGVSTGQRLGIFPDEYYRTWVATLAAIRLGLTSAILTRNFRHEIAASGTLDAMLVSSGSAISAKLARKTIEFPPQSGAALSEQAEITATVPHHRDPQTEDQARRLLFTSGTTGKPKCVLWDMEMLKKRVSLLHASQRVNADTRLITLLGMDTTGGFRYPLAVWQAGGCVIGGQPIGGAAKALGFTRPLFEQCNLLIASPQRLEKVCHNFSQPWKGREGRVTVVAGGRLARVLRDQALAIVCSKISIAYGATETGSIASGDSSLIERHSGAVGFVVDGAKVEIVDAEGSPSPRGVSGRVRMQTTYMVQKYEGTERPDFEGVFHHGWFYPGDHGVLFADGLLAIEGRGADIVNIGGGKFSLSELEVSLSRLPAVQDIGAVVLKSETGDELTFAAEFDSATDMRALSQQIAARLPVVTRFKLVRVKKIPRNAMGKIARHALTVQLMNRLGHRT